MTRLSYLARNERGVAAIETAFALPILIIMLWMFVQLAQVYRAMAGIQQALGQGARHATLCLNPVATGCAAPTADAGVCVSSPLNGLPWPGARSPLCPALLVVKAWLLLIALPPDFRPCCCALNK